MCRRSATMRTSLPSSRWGTRAFSARAPSPTRCSVPTTISAVGCRTRCTRPNTWHAGQWRGRGVGYRPFVGLGGAAMSSDPWAPRAPPAAGKLSRGSMVPSCWNGQFDVAQGTYTVEDGVAKSYGR
eukprot:gene12705-biopygen3458